MFDHKSDFRVLASQARPCSPVSLLDAPSEQVIAYLLQWFERQEEEWADFTPPDVMEELERENQQLAIERNNLEGENIRLEYEIETLKDQLCPYDDCQADLPST